MPKAGAKVERGRRNLLRRLPEFETTWQLYTHVPSPACGGMCWGDTVVQHMPQIGKTLINSNVGLGNRGTES